jgi:hypothetical protein
VDYPDDDLMVRPEAEGPAALLPQRTARPSEETLTMPLLLGCIADDFTGATDLASTWSRAA